MSEQGAVLPILLLLIGLLSSLGLANARLCRFEQRINYEQRQARSLLHQALSQLQKFPGEHCRLVDKALSWDRQLYQRRWWLAQKPCITSSQERQFMVLSEVLGRSACVQLHGAESPGVEWQRWLVRGYDRRSTGTVLLEVIRVQPITLSQPCQHAVRVLIEAVQSMREI